MIKRKGVYIISVIIILSLVVGYNYMYKNHRNIEEEKAVFQTKAKTLQKEYASDIDTATKKYIDKTIEVSGRITEIDIDNFTLDKVIVCYADKGTLQVVRLLSDVRVKGRSIGYDELLEIIKLDQVIITNPKTN
jgi:uncharacterized protein YacL